MIGTAGLAEWIIDDTHVLFFLYLPVGDMRMRIPNVAARLNFLPAPDVIFALYEIVQFVTVFLEHLLSISQILGRETCLKLGNFFSFSFNFKSSFHFVPLGTQSQLLKCSS